MNKYRIEVIQALLNNLGLSKDPNKYTLSIRGLSLKNSLTISNVSSRFIFIFRRRVSFVNLSYLAWEIALKIQ